MTPTNITRAVSLVGALLVVTTVAGCGGGGGDLDRIAEGIRGLNEGEKNIRQGLAEIDDQLKANRERLVLTGKQIDGTSNNLQTLDREIAELAAEIDRAQKDSEVYKAKQLARDAKIRFRSQSLDALRTNFAATQGALDQGLQLRQQQAVRGSLDQGSVRAFTDLGTEWAMLRTAYMATFSNDSGSAQLAPMEALLIEAIGEAAKAEPADAAGREVLSQSRRAVVAKIRIMLGRSD